MNNPSLKSASRQFAGLLPLLAWLLVWNSFPGRLEAAYKYPIGIPKAWIEPDVAAPSRPASWTKEIPGYYYVEATGTDTGRTYGYPAAPRRTIPNPIPPGSRVEVSGLYSPSTGDWFITFAGDGREWVANTSGPAWLVGGSAVNRISFAGSLYFVGQYGCVEFVDNFGSHKTTRINSSTTGKGRKANHILLRNSEFAGTNSAGDGGGIAILGNSDAGGAGENIIFYNNEVHHFGVTDFDGNDYDYIAIMIGNYCNHIWVLDNKLHDMSGSAFQVTGNTTSVFTTRYVYAGKNECYNLWGTGMASKGAEYIVYSENHIYNIKNCPGVSPSKGLSGQYAATEQWFLYNRVHGCDHGIMRVSGNSGFNSHLYAVGNVFYDIHPTDGFVNTGWGHGAICIVGAQTSYIIGNTMYDIPQGIITPAVGLLYAENNIIANLNEPTGYHFLGETSQSSKDARINNNLFFQENGSIRIQLPGEALMNTGSLNSSSYGSGNLTGDPLFTNKVSLDLSILTNSPAKDAGRAPTALEQDVYSRYFSTFGVSIERDKSGDVRPVGSAWDIGAYEFSADQGNKVLFKKITPIQD